MTPAHRLFPVVMVFMRILVSSCFLLTLSACDGESSNKGNNDIIIPTTTTASPVDFSLADSDCQSATSKATLPITDTKVYRWQGSETVLEAVELDNVYSKSSLASDIVKTTVFGEQYSRVCDLSKDQPCTNDRGRDLPWTIDADPKPLRICDPNTNFPRRSKEATALASITYLEKAFQRYNNNDLDKRPLKQIELSILPRYIEYYKNYRDEETHEVSTLRTFMTHNLAYAWRSPTEISSIIVFEEDPQWLKVQGTEGFLWESPFVLAHEFGHHIDLDRNGADLLKTGLRWNPIRHRYDDLLAESIGLLDVTQRASISGSVAEGVADLLAYYTMDAKSESLVGLICFGRNRDVTEGRFANGDDKILTEDRLSILFGETEDTTTDRCNNISYSDIHNIGAILAYTLDRAFQELAQGSADIQPGSSEDINARYRLTLAWLDEFRRRSSSLTNSASNEAILSPLTDALEVVANNWLRGISLNPNSGRTEADIKLDVCKITMSQLPILPRAPFTRLGASCS